MQALTIYQPWASLKALDEKRIETRSWATSYRGPLAIHAGQKIFIDVCKETPFIEVLNDHGIVLINDLPIGAIIAICNLVDCIKVTPEFISSLSEKEIAFGDYTLGRFAWILEDVHRLKEPIPAKGRQRIWNWVSEPHEVAIDPWVIGDTRIWTPEGIRSGKKLEQEQEDAVKGLEIEGC